MKKFKRIYLEITNVCNLKCSFCPPTQRKREYMTEENFKQIINKVKVHTDHLYFHVKGEPLMHPNLGVFLEVCEKQGLKVNLTTNGTLIKEKQEMLLASPALRQISFSLQSFEDKSDMLMKEKYIRDILNFLIKAKETNLIIELRLWNLSDQKENKKKEATNDFMLRYIEDYLKLTFEIEEKVIPGKGIKLAESVYLSQDEEFAWPSLKEEILSEEGFCYGLRSQIGILVDGTVIPCCLDSEGIVNLGNINEEDFNQIINSVRAENIINGFSNRKVVEPLCKKCGYRHRFNKVKE